MTALLLVSILLPLALSPLAMLRGPAGALTHRIGAWSAAPALVVALLAAVPFDVDVPWLLLGAVWGLDEIGRVFLILTAFLWTAAGLYAHAHLAAGDERRRFFFFFLAALCGNLGVVAARDLVSFYLFFTLMTFAAYGLIVHAGGSEAERAGRVYIALAVLGEGLLLAGGVLAAAGAASLRLADVAAAIAVSADRDLVVGLVFAGFGIKAGILPLHVWLPLAHPVAPTAASAVLSGSMVATGVLGWMRLLPLGGVGLPEWGAAMTIIGLGTAFYGVVVGVAQRDPKTILAYSTVSQMGLLACAIGLGLLDPTVAPATLATTSAYALHHGLAKGALFLGTGVALALPRTPRSRALVAAGLAFAALALAGAPLTSGAIAKHQLEELARGIPGGWAFALERILPLTAVATTVLMARFLQRTLVTSRRAGGAANSGRGTVLPWITLLAASGGALWIVPVAYPGSMPAAGILDPAMVWSEIWPILAGSMLFGIMALVSSRERRHAWPTLPPGDLLLIAERAGRALWRPMKGRSLRLRYRPVEWIANNWYAVYADPDRWTGLLRMEQRLTRWSSAGLLFVLGLVAILAVLHLTGGS